MKKTKFFGERGIVSKRERILLDRLQTYEVNHFDIIRALVNAIEAKDRYTAGHCERVTSLCMNFGQFLNLSKQEMDSLKYASILHDIGKIGIPDHILKKKGALTLDEYGYIKQHPAIGYSIVKDINILGDAREAIYMHHERLDGQGYPNGVSGDKIPYLARILTISDAFDAMTSYRSYRHYQPTLEEVFIELRKNSGTQFDVELVNQFIRAYQLGHNYKQVQILT